MFVPEQDDDEGVAPESELPTSEQKQHAEEVAAQHPVSIRSMIQTLRHSQDEGLESALLREAYAQAVCYNRGDWGAGLDAVVGRVDPTFDEYSRK